MMFNPRLFKTIYDDAVRRPFGIKAEIKDIGKESHNLRVTVKWTE